MNTNCFSFCWWNTSELKVPVASDFVRSRSKQSKYISPSFKAKKSITAAPVRLNEVYIVLEVRHLESSNNLIQVWASVTKINEL